MDRKLALASFLMLGWVAACAQGLDEGRPANNIQKQAQGKAQVCEVPGVEEQSLIDWVNAVSFDTLNDRPYQVNGEWVHNCNLPVDSANQIVRGRPYACARELADRQEVGNGVLSLLVNCGKRRGEVSPDLAAIFDQPDDKTDLAVVFSQAEADATVAFADLATKAELERVDGIGPVTAANIIALRPIRYVHRLFYQVSGIGVVRLTALKNAARGWDPELPYVPQPETGSYLLTDTDARALVTSSVNLHMTNAADEVWYNGCYLAYGGEYFTDAFSRNYCQTHVRGYLWEDTYEIVRGWVGQSYVDQAAVLEAIDVLVLELWESEFDRYIEYYAESIGEATA